MTIRDCSDKCGAMNSGKFRMYLKVVFLFRLSHKSVGRKVENDRDEKERQQPINYL